MFIFKRIQTLSKIYSIWLTETFFNNKIASCINMPGAVHLLLTGSPLPQLKGMPESCNPKRWVLLTCSASLPADITPSLPLPLLPHGILFSDPCLPGHSSGPKVAVLAVSGQELDGARPDPMIFSIFKALVFLLGQWLPSRSLGSHWAPWESPESLVFADAFSPLKLGWRDTEEFGFPTHSWLSPLSLQGLLQLHYSWLSTEDSKPPFHYLDSQLPYCIYIFHDKPALLVLWIR